MALGHLLVGGVTATLAAAASLLVMGPGWSTLGAYVLGGDLGLLLSAALSKMTGLFGSANR